MNARIVSLIGVLLPGCLAFGSLKALKSRELRFRRYQVTPIDDILTDWSTGEETEEARSQRNLRFGAVGRLYANQKPPSTDADSNELDPHLQIIENLNLMFKRN